MQTYSENEDWQAEEIDRTICEQRGRSIFDNAEWEEEPEEREDGLHIFRPVLDEDCAEEDED